MPVLQNVLRHHNKSPVKYQIPNTKHYINVSVPLGAFSAHINVHLNPQWCISFIHRKGSIISLKSLGGLGLLLRVFTEKGRCVCSEKRRSSVVCFIVYGRAWSLNMKYCKLFIMTAVSWSSHSGSNNDSQPCWSFPMLKMWQQQTVCLNYKKQLKKVKSPDNCIIASMHVNWLVGKLTEIEIW